MTITVKQHILRTASEIAMGRLMRAPDHPSDAGAPPAAAEQAAPAPAAEAAAPAALTTEQSLEVEFGQVDPPASADEGTDEAGVTEGDDPEGEGDEGDEGEKPKGKSAQERINEVTAARREAERKAADAERNAEYWRGVAEGKNQPPAEEGSKVDPEAEPDPANFEYGEADPKFIAETARFHARAEWNAQQQQAQLKTTLASMEAKWNTNIAKAVEAYPDFDAVVTKGADEQKWKCSPVVALGIKDSDVGADVAYHLATNVAESERIYGLPAIEQAREFGKLEGRFLAQAAAKAAPSAEAEPTVVKPTAAPTPPKGMARGAGGKFATPADTDDFSAFEKSADALLKTA